MAPNPAQLRVEQRRADALLLNMLPAQIAETLKHRPGTIAEQHEGASVLFADIVGFTPMCRDLSPTQVVDVLNEVFSRFDDLAQHYGVEKIKTIGDCYMVAAGVPREDARHAPQARAPIGRGGGGAPAMRGCARQGAPVLRVHWVPPRAGGASPERRLIRYSSALRPASVRARERPSGRTSSRPRK